MAIGDTVNPALMRTDFSVFQQAGLANARANEAFGNAVGNFIDDFYRKKKEKEDKQERERFYRSQGFNPDEAKAASRDKDLARFLERKRVEDRNYELAKGAEKRLSDTAEFTRGRLERADEIAEQDRVDSQSAASFFMTPRERPITQELLDDPNFQLPPLDPDPFAPPPRTFKGDSPAVAGLTGEFAKVGRQIQEGVESEKIPADEALRAIQGLQARQDALTPAPMTSEQVLRFQKAVQDMEMDKVKEARDVRAEERAETKFADEQKIKSFDGLLFEGKPLQGSIGDETEARKAKEGLANFKSIMRNLDELKELGMYRENNLIMSDDLKQEASVLADKVRGQIREEVLGPGTVQEAEYQRLADQVPDPTDSSFSHLTDAWSSTFGEEGVALIEKLQAELRQKVLDRFANYGVTFAPSGQPVTPVNQTQSNNSGTLGDGAEFEFLDLSGSLNVSPPASTPAPAPLEANRSSAQNTIDEQFNDISGLNISPDDIRVDGESLNAWTPGYMYRGKVDGGKIIQLQRSKIVNGAPSGYKDIL